MGRDEHYNHMVVFACNTNETGQRNAKNGY